MDATTNNPASPPVAEYTVASSGMFAALGATLLRGRDFAASDIETSVPVVIVNESMARWLWPNADPLGKQVHLGGVRSPAPWMTVVGVVGDMKRYSLTEQPRPEMFVPYTQKPYPTFGTMQFIVRTAGDPATLARPIQRAIAAVDPAIPIARVRTMDALVSEVSANARFATLSMTAFGAGALALAMIGLYGVIAYGVHQRRQEFGIRTALGATRQQIVALVLTDGMRLSAIGIGAGLLGALAVGRGLRSLLFQVSPMDPVTLAGAVVMLSLAAALACALPAGRASAVEPRAALVDE
jgi:putative ABC transport system permease protein